MTKAWQKSRTTAKIRFGSSSEQNDSQ